MKKIGHICNNYVSSMVHNELIKSLTTNEVMDQQVYIPVRRKSDINKNFFESESVSFKYFNYKTNFLRFFPLLKSLIIFFGFMKISSKYRADFIISHNFWSDGVVAFFNHIIYGTPYLLVVRNTDMNVFLPKLRHYHWLMKLMIKNSNGLVFISKTYKDIFQKKYPSLFVQSKQVQVIFNGVDKFWLENKILSNQIKREDKIIYVGAFNKNKNIHGIVAAAEKIYKKNPNIKLLLVGGGEKEFKELLGIIEIPEYIRILGKVSEKEKLLDLYRQSKVFIMPSFFETFGLVYIEALLQGCSIIHSKGQGIDGIFDQDFIRAVDPHNFEDIAYHIEQLLEDFEKKNIDAFFCEQLSTLFNWKKIADDYLRVLGQ